MSEKTQQSGREARMSNIKAAMNIAETVRSTLGPAGMDKMLTNGNHNINLSNMFRKIEFSHIQMMIDSFISTIFCCESFKSRSMNQRSDLYDKCEEKLVEDFDILNLLQKIRDTNDMLKNL